MNNFVLILINILLAVSGQTLTKLGVTKIGSFSDMPLVRFFQKSILSPLVVLGVFLYILSSFIWFMVLSKVVYSNFASEIIVHDLIATTFMAGQNKRLLLHNHTKKFLNTLFFIPWS